MNDMSSPALEAGATLGPMHLIAGSACTALAGWLVARPVRAPRRARERLARIRSTPS